MIKLMQFIKWWLRGLLSAPGRLHTYLVTDYEDTRDSFNCFCTFILGSVISTLGLFVVLIILAYLLNLYGALIPFWVALLVCCLPSMFMITVGIRISYRNFCRIQAAIITTLKK